MIDKMVEDMKKRIAEYSQCSNQRREDTNLHKPNCSLGSSKPEVSLYDDFELSCFTRPDLHDDMPLPSLEPDSDLPMSVSQDLSPHTSSPKGITEDVLVSADPLAPFNHSSEFEVGEDLENPSELDIVIARS